MSRLHGKVRMSRGVVISFELDFQSGVDRTESTRHRSLKVKLERWSLQVMNSRAWPRSSLQWSLDCFFVDNSTSYTVHMVMVCTNNLRRCSVDEGRMHEDSWIIGLGLGFWSSSLLDDVEVNRRRLCSSVHCSCPYHVYKFLIVSYGMFCPPVLLLMNFGPN